MFRASLAVRLEPSLLREERGNESGGWCEEVEGGCAVLVADISGFSAAEALLAGVKGGTDMFQEVLNAALGGLEAVVARHGGAVVHVAGDALLCAFVEGSPGSRRGAAVAAAQEIVDTFETEFKLPGGRTLPLAVHGSVGVGDLSVVGVGDSRCRQLTMCGPALERALRLSEEAARGQMLVQAAEPGGNPELLEGRGRVKVEGGAEPKGAVQSERWASRKASWPYLHQFYLMHAGSYGGFGEEDEQEGEGGKVLNLDVDTTPLSGVYDLASVFIQLSSFDVGSHGSGLDLAQLDAAYRAVVSECRALGGLVDILLADDKGFVFKAVFGIADLHDDFEVKAVAFALQVRDALGALGVDCKIGVASGSAFCGFVDGASGTWSGWTMLGSRAVTLAARLMTLAEPNRILVSGSVAGRSEGHVELKQGFPLMVKGLGLTEVFEAERRRQMALEMMDHKLEGAGQDNGEDMAPFHDIGDEVSSLAGTTPSSTLIKSSVSESGRGTGRQFSADVLQAGVREALDSVLPSVDRPKDSRGAGLAFVGNVGTGKTHCLRVAGERAAAAGMAVAELRSTGVDAGVPLALARSLLSEFLLLARDSPAESKLKGDVASLLEMLGMGGQRGAAKIWRATDEHGGGYEISAVVEAVVNTLGALSPLAVVIDDITFADDASLLMLSKVLHELQRRGKGQLVLFLLSCTPRGAARPLLRDVFLHGIHNCPLNPLDEEACLRLLRAYVPTGIGDTIEREVKLSGGSPAYLVVVGKSLRRRVKTDASETNSVPEDIGEISSEDEDGDEKFQSWDDEAEGDDDTAHELGDEGLDTYKRVSLAPLQKSFRLRLRKLTREILLDVKPAYVSLLKVASCIFGAFSAEDIVACLPSRHSSGGSDVVPKIELVLEGLVSDEVLTWAKSDNADSQGGLTYVFSSSIVADTLYSGLLASQKREFHRRYALYLSKLAGTKIKGGRGAVLGRDAALAMHWRLAGELELALPLYLYAGRASADAGFASDGVKFYMWAARCASNIGIPAEEVGEMETRIAVLLVSRVLDYGRACKHALRAMELFGVPFPADRVLNGNDVWRLGFCLTFEWTSLVPHCQNLSSRPDRVQCAALAAWSALATCFAGVVQAGAVRAHFEKLGQDPDTCRAYSLLMSGLLSLIVPKDIPERFLANGLLATLRFVGKGALADAAEKRTVECEALTADMKLTHQPCFFQLGYVRSVAHLFGGVNLCNAGRWTDGLQALRLAHQTAVDTGLSGFSATVLTVEVGLGFEVVGANADTSLEHISELMSGLEPAEKLINPGFTRTWIALVRSLFGSMANLILGGDGALSSGKRRSASCGRSQEENARSAMDISASLDGEYSFSPWFEAMANCTLFHTFSYPTVDPRAWPCADRFVRALENVGVEDLTAMHLPIFLSQLAHAALMLWYLKGTLVPPHSLISRRDDVMRPVLRKLMEAAKLGMRNSSAHVLRLALSEALLGEALGTATRAEADGSVAKAVASHAALRERVGGANCPAEDMWLHDIAHFRARIAGHDDERAQAWAHLEPFLYTRTLRYAALFEDPHMVPLLEAPEPMAPGAPPCC